MRLAVIILTLCVSCITFAATTETPSANAPQATQKINTEIKNTSPAKLEKKDQTTQIVKNETPQEAMSVPATIYVAVGAVIAALLTGFFSYLNLVSAKENKVSEFRLSWINGLREEIAEFTSAIQMLAHINRMRTAIAKVSPATPEIAEERALSWIEARKDSFSSTTESLTKIQLRLNPRHISENPNSAEAKLMAAIETARNLLNEKKFEECSDQCPLIREAAAPLLKSTWDLVKNGEPGYQKVRKTAEKLMIVSIIGILVALIAILIKSI